MMFQEAGRSFAQPDKIVGFFPGLVVECKSAGTKGGQHVGTDQANPLNWHRAMGFSNDVSPRIRKRSF